MAQPKVDVAVLEQDGRTVLEDKVPQVMVRRMWNVPQTGTRDADMLDLFSDVLGGSASSRLDRRLVHQDKLVDSIGTANWASQLGSIANTTRFGTPSYAISKAAQNMASALLARALGERGIVVLALHPGWVMTEMGGEHATLPTADAVRGLLAVIDAARPAQSGSFLDWRGESLPW